MIWVVEDEARLARIVLDKFERVGFREVSWLASAAALFQRLESGAHPRVVLLDTSLPDGAPLAVLARLRAAVPPDRTAILTLRDSLETAPPEAFLAAGAQRVLLKPFQPSPLAAAVRECLEAPAAPAPGVGPPSLTEPRP